MSQELTTELSGRNCTMESTLSIYQNIKKRVEKEN